MKVVRVVSDVLGSFTYPLTRLDKRVDFGCLYKSFTVILEIRPANSSEWR
jgi:hypothetical protein